MFGLFTKKKKDPMQDREIFRYWDGTLDRGIDPIKAMRMLKEHPDLNLERDLKHAEAGDQQSITNVLKAVRDIFGVTEWSESGSVASGLTEDETLNLMAEFGDFMASLKKNGSGQPISPEPSEAPLLHRSSTATSALSGSG